MERLFWRVCTPRLIPVVVLCMAVISQTVAGAVSESWAQGDSTRAAQGKPVEAKAEAFTGCIKYLGGPGFPDFKGRESWNNSLVLNSTEGTCAFGDKDTPPITFPMGNVTSIVYGQASSRHAGVWVSVGVIVAPIALIGLLHKGRKHNVLISWKGSDGREGGAYFEVQPDHFRRLLNGLSYMTGKPIYADAKDRQWLLTKGVQAQLDPAGTAEAK
jgi:hypothetical protein